MLDLTILTDNNTIIDRYYLGEPGLSFWLECGGKKFLFDTGYSDVFIRNAALMGIELTRMDGLIYSHGHNDHTWGTHSLVALFDRLAVERRPLLVAHPLAFENKVHGRLTIGVMMGAEALGNYFELALSAEPRELAPRLWWLGEIPAAVTPRRAVGKIKDSRGERDDYCLDDSALAYAGEDGLVIITGCSHSGICNIIERARDVTGERRVADVVGGFHLLSCSGGEMAEISAYMKMVGVTRLHPCHCTDFAAKAALARDFSVAEGGVGLRLNYR